MHPSRTVKIVMPAFVALAVVIAFGLVMPAQAQPVTSYEVTITNLTSGQPLSPPLLVVHDDSFHVYEPGEAASNGVIQIAENGNLAPLQAELDGAPGVLEVVTSDQGPLVPAGNPADTDFSDTVTLTVPANDGDRLSLVMMLVCTNDGFTGLDGVSLPTTAGESMVLDTTSYETGTEDNTEAFEDIMPPCQGLVGVTGDAPGTAMSNPDLAEGADRIVPHQGIQGTGGLDPDVHGWAEPASTVTITAQGDAGGGRTTDRLWGNSRIETAVAISQRAFPDSATTVYIANADNTVDAVVGGTLTDGPILLVPFSGNLPDVVRSEIQRLDPDQVIALGGSAVVSPAMLEAAASS